MVLPKAIVNHHIKKVIFSTALNKKKLTPPLLNGFKTLIGGALLSSFQQANTNTFLLPAIPAAHQCKKMSAMQENAPIRNFFLISTDFYKQSDLGKISITIKKIKFLGNNKTPSLLS